jgi:chromosome segregation ATPase
MSEEPTEPLPEGAISLKQLVVEMRSLNTRLQRVEEKFDARARETQPMSERIDRILAEVAATRHELREVNRTLRRMNVDLATALRNQDDLEDRLATLETQARQS